MPGTHPQNCTESSVKKNIKIGFTLSASPTQPSWLVETIKQISALDFVEELLILRICEDDPKGVRKSRSSPILYRGIQWVEEKILDNGFFIGKNRVHHLADLEKEIEVENVVQSFRQIAVRSVVSRSGMYCTLEVAQELEEEQLDVIIRGTGLRIVEGNFLSEAARHGVLSFHHGDNRRIRGGAPGTWEVMRREKLSGVTLQVLSPELDAGIVVGRGSVKTAFLLTLNRRKLLSLNIPMLTKVLRHLHLEGRLQAVELPLKTFFFPGRLSHRLSNLEAARYIIRIISRGLVVILKSTKEKLQKKNQQWRVFVGTCGGRIDSWQEVTPPSGHWYADPFLLNAPGADLRIVVEDFCEKKGKGRIVSHRLTIAPTKKDFSVGAPEPILETGSHLSYPFVFVDSPDKFYLIPENVAEQRVDLYQIHNEKDFITTKFQKTLLNGPFVDSTVIKIEDVYFLFTTPQLPRTPNSFLNVYYSKSLTSKTFVPHRENPIIIDPRYGRAAGRMVQSERGVIRPCQDCSEGYGGKIHFLLMQISIRSIGYSLIDTLEPLPPSLGLHHLDHEGDIGCVDVLS